MAAAFTLFSLLLIRRSRKAGAAGAAGGVTIAGILAFSACWLTGCCGSPLLPVYLGLFGGKFIGLTKPLVAAVTGVSILVGVLWMKRRLCKVEQPCSCCAPVQELRTLDTRGSEPWVVGWLDTPAGRTPVVATNLSWSDRLGAIKVRLSIRRMAYSVEPGLYSAGSPTSDSPVFVSANYKLSFDHLRRELGGLDAWILVLNTEGINVWCAAGKGTFGTNELVRRLEASGLAKVVSHHALIVPQLGASGVAAHEVKKQSGFRVIYGPVRARDIPAFLDADMQATPEMRRVRFNLRDRLAVVPVELVQWGKYALLLAACLFLLAGLNRGGYDSALILTIGVRAALLVFISLVTGGVLVPILLPWLPGRAFSIKGATLGLILTCCIISLRWIPVDATAGRLEMASWFLLIPTLTAFVAMNYTGASTYTSLSGVKREMKFAVPWMLVAGIAGLGLWLTARFLQ